MTTNSRLIVKEAIYNIVFNRKPHDFNLFKELSEQDQRFAKALLNITLENLNYIKIIIKNHMPKMPENKNVQVLFFCAIAEGVFMGSSKPWATVNEFVSLADTPQEKGLLNATLKNILSKKESIYYNKPDEIDMLPSWMANELEYQHGEKANMVAKGLFYKAPLTIRIRDLGITDSLKSLAKSFDENVYILNENISPKELPNWESGSCYVQDIASQMPILALHEAAKLETANGNNILNDDFTLNKDTGCMLDLCAAPGGKSIQMLDLFKEKVHAIDASKNRLKSLEENIARCGANIDYTVYDSLMPLYSLLDATGENTVPFLPKRPNLISLDAPCSATGTIKRHAEALWLKKPEDVIYFSKVQFQMLEQAFDFLEVGGLLSFSTCSLFFEEGEHIIEDFIKENKTAKTVVIKPALLDNIDSEFYEVSDYGVRVLPSELTDGFFFTTIKKLK